ncbi:MAG TPA: bifunctional adenosylcobinamide kinase/adenosylcobinamide-phosphate guanylyltransferase [Burkholderiales bacterium]|nr:bifunctional adenosylcobinamide kinase/adenosylcobinamide-phosphate guanylyltransferase [Burkholderiales bacterium]
MRELILGGARSGKSALAVRLARSSGLAVTVVATATAGDAEMAERIARHRAARPPAWRLVEEPIALTAALRAECAADRLVIVDCLTLWLSNLLLAEAPLESGRAGLLDALPGVPGRVLLVANEVGLGIVPENALARRFRDEQGALNQALAALCDRVTLVTAGLPIVLKGPPL